MNTTINNSNIKGTYDLYFAAALISLGAAYVDADKSDPRNVEFRVSMTQKVLLSGTSSLSILPIQEWEAGWVNGTLMVPAVRYRDALKTLKSVVHSR